ncbi:hypothetical protein INR49_029200 [Caranx melampygus]|nr:hypothetical protein INR49_029200 [Caranx melampygus]
MATRRGSEVFGEEGVVEEEGRVRSEAEDSTRKKPKRKKMKNKVSSTQVKDEFLTLVKRKPTGIHTLDSGLRLCQVDVASGTDVWSVRSQSFPSRRTGFKVGMKLEGIDQLHPSMFCVLTVAEVTGYRLRLHIDGYSECYDFWVNADSADIRPAGWCKDNNHKLHPPKGHSEAEFDWQLYLQSTDSQAAPTTLFTSRKADCGFRVGMKLEAVDKKNPGLVCVASVADVIEDRFLVHFDNWDDTYDYWSSKPREFPVGRIPPGNRFHCCSQFSLHTGEETKT